jgi:hypothetical protein
MNIKILKEAIIFYGVSIVAIYFNIQLPFLWPLLFDIWSALEHPNTVLALFYLKSKFHWASLIAYFYSEKNKVKFRLKHL